jgi:hypothetical protein
MDICRQLLHERLCGDIADRRFDAPPIGAQLRQLHIQSLNVREYHAVPESGEM